MKKFIFLALMVISNSVQASTPDLPIHCGDRVLKTHGEFRLLTVSAISENGQYLLSNGAFYSRSEIQALVPSFERDQSE